VNRAKIATVLRHCALGVIVWFGIVGCFGEAPQQESTTNATETTPTETGTTATTTADTTGGGDFIEACRACQDQQCEAYVQACGDAPGCDLCTATPFDPSCLSNADFRPLANCSCDRCGDACGYLCPGGPDACLDCQVASGCDLSECSGISTCLPCLSDPYAAGCDVDPTFMALRECHCTMCEPSCVWQCANTAPACAECLTGSCMPQLSTCLSDDTCDTCFENPETPGCLPDTVEPGNELYATLGVCVCDSCSSQCGQLFRCG
jgi:hypothetical protein